MGPESPASQPVEAGWALVDDGAVRAGKAARQCWSRDAGAKLDPMRYVPHSMAGCILPASQVRDTQPGLYVRMQMCSKYRTRPVGSPDRLVLDDNSICSRPDAVDLDLRSCCCLQAGQAPVRRQTRGTGRERSMVSLRLEAASMAHVFWNARLAASAITTWTVVRYTIPLW